MQLADGRGALGELAGEARPGRPGRAAHLIEQFAGAGAASLRIGVAGGPRQPEHRPGLHRRPDPGPAAGRAGSATAAIAARPMSPDWLRTSTISSSRTGRSRGSSCSRGIRLKDLTPGAIPAPGGAVDVPGRDPEASSATDGVPAPLQPAIGRDVVAGRGTLRRRRDLRGRPVGVGGCELPPRLGGEPFRWAAGPRGGRPRPGAASSGIR